MFWDMRTRSVELQALEPLKALEEMRGHTYREDEAVERVVVRLQANAEYRSLFAGAFGGEQPVSAENLGRALAAFQRSLLANNAPFDRYMRGDRSAMTAEQVRGMQRFERVGCIKCHNGLSQGEEGAVEGGGPVQGPRTGLPLTENALKATSNAASRGPQRGSRAGVVDRDAPPGSYVANHAAGTLARAASAKSL